jgi:hypothetical protein
MANGSQPAPEPEDAEESSVDEGSADEDKARVKAMIGRFFINIFLMDAPDLAIVEVVNVAFEVLIACAHCMCRMLTVVGTEPPVQVLAVGSAQADAEMASLPEAFGWLTVTQIVSSRPGRQVYAHPTFPVCTPRS